MSTSNVTQSQSTSRGLSISTLRRKRGNIIGQITAFSKFLDNYVTANHKNIALLQAHLNGLHDAFKKFDNVQFDLEELDESEHERRYEIQNDYYVAVARATNLMADERPAISNARETSNSPASTVSAPMAIKLPEMRLPTFDGTIETWTSFFDIFTSIIDRNEDLTPVQKLQYLRSTLTGKAAACIQSLSTTDANYSDAIDLLKAKFDCPRQIRLRHWDAIRELPKLPKDSPEALGNLIDTFNQHLRALKNLGESVNSWDTILISTLLSKVSSDTAWHWELTLKDKNMPSYTELLAFLEKRANCIPATSLGNTTSFRSTDTNRQNRLIQPRKHAFVSTNSLTCPICNENHTVRDCNQFRTMTVHDRTIAAKQASLCTNCLGVGHTVQNCRSGSCRVCHNRHHTMLHRTTYQQTSQTAFSARTPHTTDSPTPHGTSRQHPLPVPDLPSHSQQTISS